jgi:hypothetical protein
MKKEEGRNKQVSFLPGNALSFSAFAGCKKAWKRGGHPDLQETR